jgi:hypothetical protein
LVSELLGIILIGLLFVWSLSLKFGAEAGEIYEDFKGLPFAL